MKEREAILQVRQEPKLPPLEGPRDDLHPARLRLAIRGFLAFLLIELLRTEIVILLDDLGSTGAWLVFTALRLLALGIMVTAFFLALPASSVAIQRTVPRPPAGADPLLSLRAFACLLVLAGHAMAIHFVPPAMPLRLEQGSWAWLTMGSPWAGVWVFFVLSGYLMGKGFYSGRYGLNRPDVAAFYRNRLLRIVPLYYAVLLLVFALAKPQMFTLAHGWELVSLVLFTQSPESPIPVIGALWSIQTEMAFYAAVPLLFVAAERLLRLPLLPPGPRGAAVLLVALLLAGLAYRYLALRLFGVGAWHVKVYVPLFGNLDLFLLGMGLNWVVPSMRRVGERMNVLTAALAVLAVFYVVGAWAFSQATFGIDRGAYMMASITAGPAITAAVTAAAILLMEAHVAAGRQPGFLSGKLLRGTQWLGILTYAIYVWHEPIFSRQARLFKAGDHIWPSLVAFFWTTVLTMLVAYLSYLALELPLERRKVTGQRGTAPA